MDDLTLGERLATIRKRKKITQRVLAEKLGCQPSDIHRIERGVVQDPHWKRVVAWADVLDVSLDYLAGRQRLVGELDEGAPPRNGWEKVRPRRRGRTVERTT